MKHLLSLRYSLLVCVAIFVLAACNTVTEPEGLETLAKPDKEHYAFSGEGEFECVDEGFVVDFTYDVSGTVTTFYDRNGDPVRFHFREKYYGTLTNRETGYTLIDGPDSWNVFVDLVDGTESIRGLYIHFRTPDGKRIAMDVGNITFYPDGTVKIAGPHDIFDVGDGNIDKAICYYLNN